MHFAIFRDQWARRKTQILAIDAMNFRHSMDQYKRRHINRELNKVKFIMCYLLFPWFFFVGRKERSTKEKTQFELCIPFTHTWKPILHCLLPNVGLDNLKPFQLGYDWQIVRPRSCAPLRHKRSITITFSWWMDTKVSHLDTPSQTKVQG